MKVLILGFLFFGQVAFSMDKATVIDYGGTYKVRDFKGVEHTLRCSNPHQPYFNEACKAFPLDGNGITGKCRDFDISYQKSCMVQTYTPTGVDSKIGQAIANHSQELQSAILNSYKDLLHDPQFRAMLAQTIREIQAGQ